MSILAFQESPVEKPKDETSGKIIFSTQDSDREYDADEIAAEEKAIKFPKGKFKRIPPIYGTLGYLFRNLQGGKNRNDSVIECFRTAAHTNKSKFIKELIIIYDNLDEDSRHRVDIFDWFCRKQNISIAKFWGVYQEGAFSYEDALVRSALNSSKQHLISVVKKHMAKEKNHNDRKLFAEMTGLVKNEPLINIEDNSQTANIVVQNKVPNFMESLRRSEGKVDKVNEEKLLTEGTTSFIDAELSSNEKREPIPVER